MVLLIWTPRAVAALTTFIKIDKLDLGKMLKDLQINETVEGLLDGEWTSGAWRFCGRHHGRTQWQDGHGDGKGKDQQQNIFSS